MLNASLNLKVMAGYVAILIAAICTGAFLFALCDRIGKNNDEFIQVLLPKLQKLERVSKELSELQLAAYAFYGTTISAEEFNEAYKESKPFLEQSALKALDANIETHLDFEKIKSFNQGLQNLREVMTRARVDWDEAREQLDIIKRSGSQLDDMLDNLANKIEAQAQNGSSEVQQSISAMYYAIAFVGLVIFLIIFGAYFIARQGIINPALSLSNQLVQIVTNMDLTQKLAVPSKDELGDVSNALNHLQSVFREGVNTSKSSAENLVNEANNLKNLSSTVKHEISDFTHHIAQLNQQISSFEQNIQHTAEQSCHASNSALSGAEQAQKGAEIVNGAARSIDELSHDLEVSSNMILELKASGDQVGAVVTTIAEIAEQTNLLALNAAIEAARAGESGRGFAVVADEVRQLASRTHESTHQINEILATIVQSITAAVDSMNSNQAKARVTVDAVHHTVESLENIKNTVLDLSGNNQELSKLAQSNEEVISSMRNHVSKVVSSNQTVAQGGENIHSASLQLLDLADQLRKVSDQFKS